MIARVAQNDQWGAADAGGVEALAVVAHPML